MKKAVLFLFLVVLCCNVINADVRPIVIHNGGGGHDHYPIPVISEELYYDSDNHEIVFVADGTSSFYDVEIVSDSLNQTVIQTQVNGYGDIIDVSTLPSGSYTIVITSEFLNEYEGQFTI